MATADLVVRVTADTARAQGNIDGVATRMGRFQSAMAKAALPAAAVVAGLAKVGSSAVRAASDLEQADGAVQSVYGKAADSVRKYASDSAQRLGVAKSAYMQSSAVMGSALQSTGFSAEKAAKMTDQAFTRSADLAATFGGKTEEAMDAINAAVLRGEFDPIEKYGVSLNMTAVNAELAARGQDKLTGSAARQAKAQVVLEQIYKQSNKAQGQFAREADTAAGAAERNAAAWVDAQAALGTALLPVMTKAASVLASLAQWMSQNTTTVQILAGVLGGLAVAVLAVNGAFAVYTAATRVAAVATTVLNAAMRANPIGLVVTAIMALGAALVLAYKKSETFRNIVNGALNGVKTAAMAVGAAFGRVKDLVVGALGGIIGVVAGVPGKVRGALTGVAGGVRGAFSTGFSGALNVVRNVGSRIIDFHKKMPGRIKAGLAAVGKVLTAPFRLGWNLARGQSNSGVQRVLSIVRQVPGRIASALSSLAGRIRTAFSRAFSAGRAAATSGVNTVIGVVRGIPGKVASALSGLAGRMRSVFSSAMNAALGPVRSIGGSIVSTLSGILGKVQGMISKISSAVSKAKSIASKVPGIGKLLSVPETPAPATYAAMGIATTAATRSAGYSRAAAGTGDVNLSMFPDKSHLHVESGPVTVEIHLEGQQIGRFVERRVDKAVAGQARKILLRGTA